MSYISVSKKRLFKIIATTGIMLTSVAVPSTVSALVFGQSESNPEKNIIPDELEPTKGDENKTDTKEVAKQNETNEKPASKEGEVLEKSVEEKSEAKEIKDITLKDDKLQKCEIIEIKEEAIKPPEVKVVLLNVASDAVDKLKLDVVFWKINGVIKEKLVDEKLTDEMLKAFDWQYSHEIVYALSKEYLVQNVKNVDVMKVFLGAPIIIEKLLDSTSWPLPLADGLRKILPSLSEKLNTLNVLEIFNYLPALPLSRSIKPQIFAADANVTVDTKKDIDNITKFIKNKFSNMKQDGRDDGYLLIESNELPWVKRPNESDLLITFEQNDPLTIGIVEMAANMYGYNLLREKTMECTYYLKHRRTNVEIAINLSDVYDEKKAWESISGDYLSTYDPLFHYPGNGLFALYERNSWLFHSIDEHFLTSTRWLDHSTAQPVVALLCEALKIPYSSNWVFTISPNSTFKFEQKAYAQKLIDEWNSRSHIDASLKPYTYEVDITISNKHFPFKTKNAKIYILPASHY